MKKAIIIALLSAAGVASVPSSLAQGCCAGGGTKGGCTAASVAGAPTVATNSGAKSPLPQPVQAVFDSYFNVQSALAADSFPDFQTAARSLARISQATGNSISSNAVRQSENLAKAADLASARRLFKPLSESLITWLHDQKSPAGVYREAYCPMANASWIQVGETINNPYMGKKMLRCGEFKS